MKTTLDLNDALLAEAKAVAAQQRTTLTRLVEEGLQLRLRKQRLAPKSTSLPVYRGKGGLAPGLDGLSNKALLEAAGIEPATTGTCPGGHKTPAQQLTITLPNAAPPSTA